MSSTSQPPGPPPGPPPPEAAPLTASEHDALSRLAAAERIADPRFADDLAAGRVTDPAGRAPRWVAVLGAVLILAVLAGLALGPWYPFAAVLAVAVAVPVGLVRWAGRQARSGR